jgi:hypothetical protein
MSGTALFPFLNALTKIPDLWRVVVHGLRATNHVGFLRWPHLMTRLFPAVLAGTDIGVGARRLPGAIKRNVTNAKCTNCTNRHIF